MSWYASKVNIRGVSFEKVNSFYPLLNLYCKLLQIMWRLFIDDTYPLYNPTSFYIALQICHHKSPIGTKTAFRKLI